MEGVETAEENTLIRESGCDLIQGYYCLLYTSQPKFWYGGNYLDDAFPNNGPAIRLLVKIPWLSCPDHPDANCRIIEEESINVKAAWKRYLAVQMCIRDSCTTALTMVLGFVLNRLLVFRSRT